jgi:hypothetical protein
MPEKSKFYQLLGKLLTKILLSKTINVEKFGKNNDFLGFGFYAAAKKNFKRFFGKNGKFGQPKIHNHSWTNRFKFWPILSKTC